MQKLDIRANLLTLLVFLLAGSSVRKAVRKSWGYKTGFLKLGMHYDARPIDLSQRTA